MRSKDQIFLENAYEDVLNNNSKSKYQKIIDSLPEKPEIVYDHTSEMKGSPIPIKNLEVGKIYDVLVSDYYRSDGGKIKISKSKKEGLRCEKAKEDVYKIGAIFKLKGPNFGPGSLDYDVNANGDTQYGNNIQITVYESDVTPEEFELRSKKGIQAFHDYEDEYKRRHGRDSSPWD